MGRGYSWLAFLIWLPAPAQQPATEAQTSQMMLAEIRQLRHDLEAISMAVERTQIVIFRLQLAETAANRAAAKVEEARSSLQNAREARQRTEQGIKQLETEQSLNAQPAMAANRLGFLKQSLEELAAVEQRAQAELFEAESALRTAKSKRDELWDTVDRIDKVLAATARPPAEPRQ